ncbi:MAG: beta-lactamase family protein, partial [Gemmatimonadota bacterium]|nr:beta-lactamase family protein [Gemmatimonadota bacterium]
QQQPQQRPTAAPAAPPAAQQPTTSQPRRGVTDKAELEAFLDGMMLAQMADKHIAGGVVSVVKDGSLFFAKGYGYADVAKRTPVDPARTLFRIGSVSKLFTWTTVMQQVEAGKLDLDADVNKYLDFKIPATFPQPITLRHMMSHSAGFEEDSRELFQLDSVSPPARGAWLQKHMPKRVRPPGTYSAYSNYATAMAGYIVDRVSGVPWEQNIEQRIFQPLGMKHTSGRQPLPANLAPDMSVGYSYEAGKFVPKKFEFLFPAAPAGAVSSSGIDMAIFMLAHLGNGAIGDKRILGDSIARLMHTRSFTHDPRINGWDLGFYEQSSHGLTMLGHGGDTQWFHSDLSLIPSERLGVFVSFNTNTGAVVSFGPFMKEFLNHYFPTPIATVPRPADALAQAKRVAGEYASNRHSYTTFQKAAGLAGATKVAADTDGTLIVASPFGLVHFVPIGPLLYREELGEGMLAFKADSASGKITRAFFSENPTDAEERLSFSESPKFHLFLLGFGIFVFVAVIASAIARFFRRRVGKPRPEDELPGRWFVVCIAIANVIFIIALASLLSDPFAVLTGSPTSLKVALALPVIAGLLTLAAIVAAVLQWLGDTGTRAARLRYDAVVVIALLFVWSLNHWNLLGWSM